ncbi:hypothetical protein Clacol_009195 [Clathrus columnatus]|uniref:Large ribosomal subunit protein mL59 domain-containing protein n=1 Tax=Clathrus columnatus TaxID=1419009 RepID=A0AAV5AKI8_9AGAM|nr:hypothetical protein Clacol_009195 [Clathrus columnatus]
MATTTKRGLNLVQKFRIREFQRVLPTGTATSSSLTSNPAIPNPFIPHLNPETGRWAPPRYSLRRQAELIKQAKKNGTLYLLPPGPKLKPRGIPSLPELAKTPASIEATKSEFTQPVDWIGEVKVHEPAGANVGNRLYAAKKQMFKGHKWERVYRRERKYRRILMKHMPKRVRKWRLYYVSRRPWPLSTIRGKKGKSRVLPF